MKHLLAFATSLALAIAPMVVAPSVATANPGASPMTSQQAIEVVVQRALSQRGVPFVYGGGGASGPSARPVPAGPAAGTFPASPTVPGTFPASPTVPGTFPASPTVPGAYPATPTVPGAYPASPNVPGATGYPATPTVPGAAAYPASPALPGAGAYPASPTVPGAGAYPGAAAAPGAVGFDASGLMVYAYAGVGIKLPRSSGEQYATGRKIVPAQARRGDLIFYGPGGSQSVALFLGNGQMVEVGDAVQVSPVRSNDMAPFLVRVVQ